MNFLKTTLLLFLIFFSVSSQEKQNKTDKIDRIDRLKKVFFVKHLELSNEQTIYFWPLYVSHKKEIHNLMVKKSKFKKSIEKLSLDEKTAKKNYLIIKDIEKKINLKRTAFQKKITPTINYKQLILLSTAEYQFRKKLLNELKRKKARAQKKAKEKKN